MCSVLSTGLYLVGQAAAAACAGGGNVFNEQGCDPAAGTGTVPPETMVLPMVSVLLIQQV